MHFSFQQTQVSISFTSVWGYEGENPRNGRDWKLRPTYFGFYFIYINIIIPYYKKGAINQVVIQFETKYSRVYSIQKYSICLSRPYPFNFFKGCLPQILLGPYFVPFLPEQFQEEILTYVEDVTNCSFQ